MTVSCDTIANTYNRRYELHDYPGIRSAILGLVGSTVHRRVLEVGCGTCKWLALLAEAGCEIAGIDPSKEMLLRAPDAARGDIREGVAEASLSRRSAWSEGAGLAGVAVRPVALLRSSGSFDELLRDGVLEQSYTSQLTALTAAECAAGMQRVREAAQRDPAFRFVSDLTLYATEASKPV